MEVETIAAPPATEQKTEQKTPDKVPEQKATETKEERRLKLKYGKTEREVTEQEAVALAQKGWAADERFKSAAQMKREAEELLENADLDGLIQKKAGKSKLEWAKDMLKAELRRKTMSPEELEIEDRQNRLQKLREEEEGILEKKAEERRSALQAKYEEQYDRELSEALKKHGMPANKYCYGRAVKIGSEIVSQGLEPDWDLVAQEAKRQVQEELAAMVDQLEDSVGFIGEERARKISKLLVSKGVPRDVVARVVKQSDEKPERQAVDADDYWERKRAQFHGK